MTRNDSSSCPAYGLPILDELESLQTESDNADSITESLRLFRRRNDLADKALPALIRVARAAENEHKALFDYLFNNVEEDDPRAKEVWGSNYELWQALQQLRAAGVSVPSSSGEEDDEGVRDSPLARVPSEPVAP